MKRLKKTLAAMLALNLFISAPASFAYNKLYHTYTDTTLLSPGVTLTTEQRMTDTGWFNINLVTVDLTNPAVESTVLLPEYISEKAPLSALSNSEEDVVAAINGDFFDTQGRSTLGMVVKDGEYITSSIHDDRFYTYLQMNDGRSYIAKVLGESTKLSNADYSLDITYTNKPYLQYDRAIVFDRNWGNASIGNTNSESVLEIVVVDDTVISIALDPAPQKIPENGYIVAVVGTLIPEAFANFKVGDTVELSNGAFLSHIDQAIGGGAKILTDGVPESDFSLNISGRHPRSALGFSQDNKTLYLVTIDGRSSEFTGMTQTELAYLMAEAGAYNAINLDGGGSSEMTAKRLGNDSIEIVNYPSEGVERRIHNGIGIKNVGAKGSLDSLMVEVSQERYFMNSSISPSVKGLDKNLHSVAISPGDVSYEASGVDHIIKDGEIVPLEQGELKITAKHGSATGEVTVTVIGEPERLSVSPKSARLLPGESLNVSLTGYDENGFSAPLQVKDVNILQTGLKGTLIDSKYTVTEPGSGYVRFSLGEADAFMAVGAGESAVLLHDFESQIGSFVSYPETVKGSYMITPYAHTGSHGGALQYDFKTDAATRAAYVKFGDDGLVLPDNTNKLKLWVYGDYGNGHWLRGKVTDTSGDVHTIDFVKTIDWKGWQQVEATLSSDIEYQSLSRIYLVETDPAIRDAGVLVIDDLEAVVTASPPNDLTAMSASAFDFETVDDAQADFILQIGKTTQFVESLDESQESQTENADEPSPVTHSLIEIADDKLINLINDKAQFLSLNNSKRALSRSESSMGWKDLLSHQPDASKSDTVVLLSNPYDFKNKYDDMLFKDTLNSFRTEQNHRVTVVSPGTRDSIDLIDGIWFITYSQDEITQFVFELDQKNLSVGKQTVITFDIPSDDSSNE